MPSHHNLRDRNKDTEEFIDYSKYFHEERIPTGDAEPSASDHVSLLDISSKIEERERFLNSSSSPDMYFQCGMCDMLVGEDDKMCPFCGAEFAKDNSNGFIYEPPRNESGETGQEIEVSEEPEPAIMRYERDPRMLGPELPNSGIHEPEMPDPETIGSENQETMITDSDVSELLEELEDESPVIDEDTADIADADSSKKINVVRMLKEGKGSDGGDSQSGKAANSFSSSARLLQKMENIVDQASTFGAETNEARRLLVAAWKACEEGNWNIVTSLAEETKKTLVPNIDDLIRSHVSSLREVILDLKFKGAKVGPQITKIKLIRKAMDDLHLDTAMELTKELIDETREVQKPLHI